jgi:hypothetical protein
MTTKYKYINKDIMKCGNYTTSGTGRGDVTYFPSTDISFNNVPITIASPFSTGNVLVTTCIYNQNVSNFDSISYYKQGSNNSVSGGQFNNGTIFYFSIDDNAIQKYKYNGKPIIKAGTFEITTSTGKKTHSFGDTFTNNPIIVVCPIGEVPEIITCTVISTTTTDFSVVSYFKDGVNSGRRGGPYYTGNNLYDIFGNYIIAVDNTAHFNYIAVDNSAMDSYYSNGNRTIKCGTFTTGADGKITGTAPSLGFPTGSTVRVFCSPTGETGTGMVTCNIVSVSESTFTVLALLKDGRDNQDGGSVYAGNFNYIAVINVAA